MLQVRGGELQTLLWQRAQEPHAGAWALPGGYLGADETLEESIRRHLADKVDVREIAHVEQLGTLSEPSRYPGEWQLATAYVGLVASDVDPAVPADTTWHTVDRLPALAFDHRDVVLEGRDRLRAKLSYTNVGFALAPAQFTISELRDLYAAALGHEVTATNLQRVLVRRGVLEPTGYRRESGPAGGRPPALFSFRQRELEVTDPFAVLRPPDGQLTAGARWLIPRLRRPAQTHEIVEYQPSSRRRRGPCAGLSRTRGGRLPRHVRR